MTVLVATGAPGSGKTTTLAGLGDGITVVPEAATDVVAELLVAGVARPEQEPDFLDRIVARQRERRLAAHGDVQVHDRSVFCTLALATFLELPVPGVLIGAPSGLPRPRLRARRHPASRAGRPRRARPRRGRRPRPLTAERGPTGRPWRSRRRRRRASW